MKCHHKIISDQFSPPSPQRPPHSSLRRFCLSAPARSGAPEPMTATRSAQARAHAAALGFLCAQGEISGTFRPHGQIFLQSRQLGQIPSRSTPPKPSEATMRTTNTLRLDCDYWITKFPSIPNSKGLKFCGRDQTWRVSIDDHMKAYMKKKGLHIPHSFPAHREKDAIQTIQAVNRFFATQFPERYSFEGEDAIYQDSIYANAIAEQKSLIDCAPPKIGMLPPIEVPVLRRQRGFIKESKARRRNHEESSEDDELNWIFKMNFSSTS